MKRETLETAIELNDELNRIDGIIRQVEAKLATAASAKNWNFENVTISSVPMGLVQVPEHMAGRILMEIQEYYQKGWDKLKDKLDNL
jgi:hypothetical protein